MVMYRSIGLVRTLGGRTSNRRSRSTLLRFDRRDELHEPGRLLLQPLDELRVDQVAVAVELAVALADEQALRVEVGVAVAAHLLQVLDRAQALELAGREADEGAWPAVEALGIRQHVDEQLERAGEAAVVLRHHE